MGLTACVLDHLVRGSLGDDQSLLDAVLGLTVCLELFLEHRHTLVGVPELSFKLAESDDDLVQELVDLVLGIAA